MRWNIKDVLIIKLCKFQLCNCLLVVDDCLCTYRVHSVFRQRFAKSWHYNSPKLQFRTICNWTWMYTKCPALGVGGCALRVLLVYCCEWWLMRLLMVVVRSSATSTGRTAARKTTAWCTWRSSTSSSWPPTPSERS